MKRGSGDDLFVDEVTDGADDTEDTASLLDSTLRTASGDEPDSGAATSDYVTTQTTRQSLPYIHARDGLKNGRTQRPVFLCEHIEDGIDELLAEMEAELDEDVYKRALTEAAMAVAQEHPELVLAKLKEWGYGLR